MDIVEEVIDLKKRVKTKNEQIRILKSALEKIAGYKGHLVSSSVGIVIAKVALSEADELEEKQ
jgi:hypothetical protein